MGFLHLLLLGRWYLKNQVTAQLLWWVSTILTLMWHLNLCVQTSVTRSLGSTLTSMIWPMATPTAAPFKTSEQRSQMYLILAMLAYWINNKYNIMQHFMFTYDSIN